MSSVAMGFFIRSWYILRELDNSIFVMTLISFGCVLYLWCFFALTRIPFIKRSKPLAVISVILYLALSAALYTVPAVGIVILIFTLFAMLGADNCDCECGDGSCCDCCDSHSHSVSDLVKKKKKTRPRYTKRDKLKIKLVL